MDWYGLTAVGLTVLAVGAVLLLLVYPQDLAARLARLRAKALAASADAFEGAPGAAEPEADLAPPSRNPGRELKLTVLPPANQVRGAPAEGGAGAVGPPPKA